MIFWVKCLKVVAIVQIGLFFMAPSIVVLGTPT